MAEAQEVQQTVVYGETSGIRRVHPEIPDDLKILEEIDNDPQRITWFESRPQDYVPKARNELIKFATSDNEHLLYAVSGAEGTVDDEEVGRLQGWVLVKPDEQIRIREMVSKGFISDEASKNPVLEFEYARRKDAASGQMASAVRQVALLMAEISLESTDETPFPPPLIVTAYIIDKEPENTASINVLQAAGFEEVGEIQFDDAAEKPDRLFVLNWQKLMDIERRKTEPTPAEQFQPEIFDKSPESWDAIKDQVLPMSQEGLDWEPDQPMEGQTDDITAYANIEEAFKSPDTTTVVLKDLSGKIIGYTLAFPFQKMDPESAKRISKAAYIYFTVLDQEHRGQGLVGQLVEPLFEELDSQGYERVVRDSKREDGYAGKVARHYAGSIIEQTDHEYWPVVGPETRFVIDIVAHLAQHSNPPATSSE